MKEIELTSIIKVYSYGELSPGDRALIDMAKEATTKSYAPYSKFHVAAAVQLANGNIITGTNQENAAYPSGLCAERTALFYANAQYPDQPVTVMAVAAYTNGKFLCSPIPPCGACRQVMLGVEERYNNSIRILLYGENAIYEVNSVKALLPLQFVGDSMKE